MDYILRNAEPRAVPATATLEFVTPKTKQQPRDVISATKSPWDLYQKREKIEEFKVDFHAIYHGMQQDGYLRTSVNKYVNSIFLRGYKIHTLKPAIDKYLRLRLQMLVDAMPDHNHLDDFFQAVAKDLVAYANVYIVKRRRRQPIAPKGVEIKGVPRIKPKGKPDDKPQLEQRDPIVAYELVHPAMMHIIRDQKANVLRYEQWPMHAKERPADKKNYATWQPDEIIHIAVDKEDGYAYGTPFLSAAIDDVRMLRSLEDHVSRLSFRFAFPFTQVRVGEAIAGFQASEEDLTYYRNLVSNAPPDATLTTSEKVKFEVVGAQGAALNMEPYLKHFKSRVFTGLGVSAVSMGEGDTANRSTADAMSTEMHDQIKHFQNVLARNISNEIFRELLLEGGYDLYADIDKNWAHLLFEEIEVESQIKREAHTLALLQANMITFTEARKRTGYQPFTDKDWDDSYLYRFLAPQDFIKKTGMMDVDKHHKLILEQHDITKTAAGDAHKAAGFQHKGLDLDNKLKQKELDAPPEQGTAAGAHQTVTTGHTVKSIPGGGRAVTKTQTVKTPVTAPQGHFAGDQPGPKAAPKTTVKKTGNTNQPANQHGKRSAPKRKSEFVATEALSGRGVDIKARVLRFYLELSGMYSELRDAAIEQGELHRKHGGEEPKLVELLFELQKNRIASLSRRYLQPAFMEGVAHFDGQNQLSSQGLDADSEIKALQDFNERTIMRLIRDLARPTLRIIKNAKEDTDLKAKISTVFDEVEYRLSLIANTEMPQAFWFGYASAGHWHDIELEIELENDPCEDCILSKSQLKNTASARKRLSIVPTLHPNCNCSLKVVDGEPQA